MKPPRLNKLRSNLAFLRWLIKYRLIRAFRKDTNWGKIDSTDLETQKKVDYYCKITAQFSVVSDVTIQQIPYFQTTGYNYDFHRIMAPFPSVKFHHLWGDIKHVPDAPTFVRSRPIKSSNQNSVLLPLNTRRLFETYIDPFSFEEKKAGIVWRGAVYKQHRIDLLRQGERLAFCDFGAINKNNPELSKWQKQWMTPQQQMRYKFIFVIEGNDIASNTRWVMASNSACMMRKPRFESWFGEGNLVAGVHYIEVADDFSNIEEKFNYYRSRPSELKEIIANANRYVADFGDLTEQYRVGMLVVKKYARLSGQLKRM